MRSRSASSPDSVSESMFDSRSESSGEADTVGAVGVAERRIGVRDALRGVGEESTRAS
jgi:hypothetical protein